jgi:hypothetical protein
VKSSIKSTGFLSTPRSLPWDFRDVLVEIECYNNSQLNLFRGEGDAPRRCILENAPGDHSRTI